MLWTKHILGRQGECGLREIGKAKLIQNSVSRNSLRIGLISEENQEAETKFPNQWWYTSSLHNVGLFEAHIVFQNLVIVPL